MVRHVDMYLPRYPAGNSQPSQVANEETEEVFDWELEENPPPSAPTSDSEHQHISVLVEEAVEQLQLVATSSLLPQTSLSQELVDIGGRPSGSNAPRERTSRRPEGLRSGRLSTAVVQGCPLLTFGAVFAPFRGLFTGMIGCAF